MNDRAAAGDRRRTKELVWRAEASDTISDKPEKNEKKLKKYPPGKE